MKGNIAHKNFIFNEKIDTGFLYSLYEDDYEYIEEVFQTIILQYSSDLTQVQTAFETQDVNALQRSVHKIKPSLGFAGLLFAQEICGEFENKCVAITTVEHVSIEYRSLNSTLIECLEIIRNEHQNLKKHNAGII